MMSQDNRLLPLAPTTETLERPLRDLSHAPPVVGSSSAGEPAHLREYVAVVFKRKWLILSLMVVITSLVAIQMYRLPSIYEAKTQIEIAQKGKSILSTSRAGDLVIRGGNDANYWNTQIKKLESQKLARQIIIRLDLQNNPAFLGANRGTGLITSLRRIISREKPQAATTAQTEGGVPVLSEVESPSVETLTPEQALNIEPFEDTLRANLNIEPVERTNLVNIRFQHNDPRIAQNVVNMMAEVFKDNDIRDETVGSDRANTILGKQITELQDQIRNDEAARLSYMQARGIPIATQKAADLTGVRLETYSSQLQAAEADRKSIEAAYREAEAAQARNDIWSVPAVQEDKAVQRIREKLENLRQRREELLVLYTPEWPEVKKIDSQMAQLQTDLNKAPGEIIRAMKNRLDAAVKKESGLKGSYFGERADATQTQTAVIGLGDITQRLETNKQLLSTYFQRQKELQVTSSDRTNNVTQIEEARLPREPIGPQRVRNIVIALMLSLGVGIGLAFLLDYLDDTLKSIEDVDRHLHLPTLALIPAPREARRFIGQIGRAHV